MPGTNQVGGQTDTIKALAGPLGCAIRGMGGEHTAVGADGSVDVSPTQRMMITEAEILQKLYTSVVTIFEAEIVAQRQGAAGLLQAAHRGKKGRQQVADMMTEKKTAGLEKVRSEAEGQAQKIMDKLVARKSAYASRRATSCSNILGASGAGAQDEEAEE